MGQSNSLPGPGDLKVEDVESCAWLSRSKSKDTHHCLHKTLLGRKKGENIFKTNKEITYASLLSLMAYWGWGWYYT